MSIISKIKMPGMADAYDIGVDWENVKDKPDVGSIDVGVTNEVLNIDTNNDIAVSGSSSSEIPAWTDSDEFKVLTLTDTNSMAWTPIFQKITSPQAINALILIFLRLIMSDKNENPNIDRHFYQLILSLNENDYPENNYSRSLIHQFNEQNIARQIDYLQYHYNHTFAPIAYYMGDQFLGYGIFTKKPYYETNENNEIVYENSFASYFYLDSFSINILNYINLDTLDMPAFSLNGTLTFAIKEEKLYLSYSGSIFSLADSGSKIL